MKKPIIALAVLLSGIISMNAQNITGKITSTDGKPLENVKVSDGYVFAKTDKNGNYALESNKVNGYVFVEVPSGYEPIVSHAIAQFWANLETDDPAVAETHDFQFKKVNQKNFKIVAMSDIHLAGRENDREQFCANVIPVFRQFAKDHENERVYAFNTGDTTFDIYWYCDRFAIEDYVKMVDVLDFPFLTYYTNGNHDHDGATVEGEKCDFEALRRFNKVLGPAYYSINIGQWHIIFLDNIIYKNEDLPTKKVFEGIYGARNYKVGIEPRAWEWLKEDLKDVSTKTPIMVCMHAPAFRPKGTTAEWQRYTFSDEDCQALIDLFKDYKQVHLLDGHSHRNSVTYVTKTLTDHNIGSVAGMWWRCGNWNMPTHTTDGSLTNVEIFDVKGKKMTWKYYSFAHGYDKLFYAYDMNECRKAWNTDPFLVKYAKAVPAYQDYQNVPDNCIWVNVFGWDSKYKVEILENGKQLEVKPIWCEDPFFMMNYGWARYCEKEKVVKEKNKYYSNIFTAKASSATSTITVRVTDAFGNVFTEKMERPKAFTSNMK